jgi:hypothetical protein
MSSARAGVIIRLRCREGCLRVRTSHDDRIENLITKANMELKKLNVLSEAVSISQGLG